MKKVLMIEDEKDFQRIVRRILEPAGYQFVCADSAEEGFELIQREAVDLAIVDWNLPGKSGLDFCRRVREDIRFREIPLIMLTVRSLPDEQIKGLQESGVDLYMTKPIKPNELLARIQSFLKLMDS